MNGVMGFRYSVLKSGNGYVVRVYWDGGEDYLRRGVSRRRRSHFEYDMSARAAGESWVRKRVERQKQLHAAAADLYREAREIYWEINNRPDVAAQIDVGPLKAALDKADGQR